MASLLAGKLNRALEKKTLREGGIAKQKPNLVTKTDLRGQDCTSESVFLPSMCKALDSIISTRTEKRLTKEAEEEGIMGHCTPQHQGHYSHVRAEGVSQLCA